MKNLFFVLSVALLFTCAGVIGIFGTNQVLNAQNVCLGLLALVMSVATISMTIVWMVDYISTNTMSIRDCILTVTFLVGLLIALTQGAKAQNTFPQFIEEVNLTTGIETNDYMSNVKKAHILGFPNSTLWELYLLNVEHYKLTGKVAKMTVKEEVIIPQIVTKVEIENAIDTMKYIHTINNLTQIATEQETTISDLVRKVDMLKGEIAVIVSYNNNLQSGDVLVANKKYTKIKCVRTGKVLSASQFDNLVERGVVSPLKNKMWIYTSNEPFTKMGLGDGFIFIILCLLLLLGGAKIIATPKQSPKLADTLYQLSEEKAKVKVLSKEVEDLKKKTASQEATIIKLSK